MGTKKFNKTELIDICKDIMSSSLLWSEFFEVAPFTTPWVVTFQHKPINGHRHNNGIIKIDIQDENKTIICPDLPPSWDINEVVYSRKASFYRDLFEDVTDKWIDPNSKEWKSPKTKTMYLLDQIRKRRKDYVE